MTFYCELHSNEECIVDEEGYGSCGDWNKEGNCLWCLKDGDVLQVIKK